MTRYEVVETIDGEHMVLADGFQVGGEVDHRIGCGTRTFATDEDAQAYAQLLEKQGAAR